MSKEEKRFEKVYSQGSITRMEIWVDKETGVQYVWSRDGYAGGLTVLVDGEGRPLLHRPSGCCPEL